MRNRAVIAIAVVWLPIQAVLASPVSERPAGSSRPGDAVAEINGNAISLAELEALVGNRIIRLRSDEYRLKRSVLDGHIASLLLQKEAAARGITVEELTRTEIDDWVAARSPANKLSGLGASPPQSRDVSEGVGVRRPASAVRQERLRRRREFLKDLYSKADVKVWLEPPRVSIVESSAPSKGPIAAPVTLVEFLDYQCPFCARAVTVLKRVEETYKDKVRLVIRDFPLPGHPHAEKAAEAAACAGEKGKFWEMHDRLLNEQGALGSEEVRAIAGGIGLDLAEFKTCMDSGRSANKWRADQSEGVRLGVGGTPTMFVNGRMISGAVSYDALAEVIEDELTRSQGRQPVGTLPTKRGQP